MSGQNKNVNQQEIKKIKIKIFRTKNNLTFIKNNQSILNKSQITLEDTNQESLNQFNKF